MTSPRLLPTRAAPLASALLAAVLLLACAPAGAQQAQDAPPLTVMTFNVRWAGDARPNAWRDRRPVMRELIQRANPDVFGTQEGLNGQLGDMAADLPAYRWIGLGRDGGSRGEFMAVFYRADRLEPLEYDHFWLSDTPATMGSRSWGNNYTRMVTWVRFRDRRSGRQFVFINTHLDHEVQEAREKAAELILQRARAWDASVPVLLVGDFNADAGANRVYDLLTGASGGFTDSWRALGLADTLGTFHDFKGLRAARTSRRIDWILTRGPVTALSSAILTYQRNGQYPSDHFPVVARVRISAAK